MPTRPKWLTVLHSDDRDLVAKTLERIVRESVRIDVTYRVDHPKQGKRIMHSTGEPVVEDGRVTRLIGNTLDITEQENAAQELQRSEFYLREGERLAHMGSWSLRPDGIFDYWSPETFVNFGFDPDKGIPTLSQWLHVLHADDRNVLADLIRKMFSEGVNGDVQYRVHHPRHGERTMHSTGDPVFENGKVSRLIGNTLDITEQENAVQELRRRKAYMDQGEALGHTGSFGWNLATGEIVWSDETFRILGYEPTTQPTLDFVFKRVHPEDLSLVHRVIENAKAGESLDFEHRLLLPDGSVKHVHVIARPLTSESNEVEFVGTVMDVTASKEAFEEIKALRDELQRENIVR